MPIPGVEMLGELAEKGLQKLTGAMENSKVGKEVLSTAGNQEWELDLHPGGRAVKAMNMEYIRLHDKSLKADNDNLAAVRDWHAKDNVARNQLPVKTATMGEYRAHAVATNHPIRQVIRQIVNADPENIKLTQQQMMTKNMATARLSGLAGSYGSNFENVTPIIAGMLTDKDPRVVSNGHRVAQIVSNQVRDTKLMQDFSGGNSMQSASAVDMNKAFKSANKIRAVVEEPEIPMLRTDPTYSKPSETERAAHRVLNTVLTPFIAIPHIGQLFHLPASSPLSAVGKALFRMDHAEMSKTVEASSILANTVWRETYADILAESGKVSQWTNSPTTGKILGRTYHQPGFDFVRKQQLNFSGAVGFHSAIFWAHNAAQGSKIAAARLEEMGLDPKEVIAQGGKLNEDQLQKGVYHFVNNRMFFNKSIDNSLYQNRNFILRAGFMYHSFVGSETSYLRRELLLMSKAGDYKGLAQFAGTLGVLFPAVAPLIAGAELLARTGSPTQAGAQVQKQYASLTHPSDAKEWLGNYVELLSHIGAAGVYFNYINAIKANRLMSAMAGPIFGAATTDVTDAYHAAFMPTKSGRHPVEPLERDVLKQTIPVVGSMLAHQLVPTKAERGSTGSSPHLGGRGIGRGSRRR